MTASVAPTFLLRGLDHRKVVADYKSGFFSRPVTSKSKIKIVDGTSMLLPTYGSSNAEPVFCVKDKNNASVIIATTNHANFEVFTQQGGRLLTGGRCEYCRSDFDHTAIGYPLKFEESSILITDTEPAVYRNIYNFWVEGHFCSFECALSYVRQLLVRPSDYRDTTIRESERLLKLLYILTYPEAPPLRPAQDPRLLQCNGGSLTQAEWKDRHHIYVQTGLDRVMLIPAKGEYIRQAFASPITSIDISQNLIQMGSSSAV